MKRSSRFLALFLALAVIFSAVFCAATYFELDAIRKNNYESTMRLVSGIKEKYPEVSYAEAAKILNEKTDIADAQSELEKYGITGDEWAVLENNEKARGYTAVNTALCALICLVFCGVFALYLKRRRAEERLLAEYIARINNKQYDLEIEYNSEDDMSLLKNELYKVTVSLREQADNSLKAKMSLKKSLSDISHQLKTPITSIMITVDNLLDDENMPTALRREFLQDIMRATNGISFLVQSLLTLSRIDADALDFKVKSAGVQKIAEECQSRLSVLAELRGVDLAVNCPEINIECDYRWICEAITNIAKNCIEHTQSGGTVEISAEQNKLYTLISISDNGDGINEKDLPHIFERFYKGKNAAADSVGIGLALAKVIIEKSGGTIDVYSRENEGSRFDIKLFLR